MLFNNVNDFNLFLKAGTKRTLDLAKKMRKLLTFIHLSTAFCHIDQEELGERIYDSPNNPQEIMRIVEIMDDESVDLITPK